jgi:hypothetical protein
MTGIQLLVAGNHSIGGCIIAAAVGAVGRQTTAVAEESEQTVTASSKGVHSQDVAVLCIATKEPSGKLQGSTCKDKSMSAEQVPATAWILLASADQASCCWLLQLYVAKLTSNAFSVAWVHTAPADIDVTAG